MRNERRTWSLRCRVYSVGVPADPVDFDALLEALGAANAEPPPLMKKLLAESHPVSTDSSIDETAVVAELKAWLAVLRNETRFS